jgi:hypothetical protein
LADRPAAAISRHDRLLNVEPLIGSHVVRSNFSFSRTNNSRIDIVVVAAVESISASDERRRRRPRTGLRFSDRLPNTPCEVGIFKTVEFVKELYMSESIVPNWTL